MDRLTKQAVGIRFLFSFLIAAAIITSAARAQTTASKPVPLPIPYHSPQTAASSDEADPIDVPPRVIANSDEIPDEMKSKDVFIPAEVNVTKVAQAVPAAEESSEKDQAEAPPAPEVPAKEVDPHEIVVLQQLSGPQQTIRFFFRSCSRSNYPDAIRCLDFSQMPELDTSERFEYAHQLAAILIRLDNFSLDGIPETYEGNECDLWPDHNYKAIRLVRSEDGTLINMTLQEILWDDLWNQNMCQLELPFMPNASGSYTVYIYFDGMLAVSQVFTI